MTMKVTEHIIKVARKEHPNDCKYPCRSSQEILHAGMKLMTSLSSTERNLLKVNNLILDEEETAELFDSIKEKDIIGLGILRQKGFTSNKYEVSKIFKSEDYILCKNLYTKEEEEISFQDISIAFALGFADILYRDEKPFGLSEEIEYKISIQSNNEEENKENKEDTINNNENDSQTVEQS